MFGGLFLGMDRGTNRCGSMLGLRVSIVRWVDDHQPGWVECHLTDYWDQSWVFVEKAPVVSAEDLGPETTYPRPGVIACELVERSFDAIWFWDHDQHFSVVDCMIVVVSTAVPWGVVATTGETRFSVRPGQVVGLEKSRCTSIHVRSSLKP